VEVILSSIDERKLAILVCSTFDGMGMINFENSVLLMIGSVLLD
jgi:hypothetical protein